MYLILVISRVVYACAAVAPCAVRLRCTLAYFHPRCILGGGTSTVKRPEGICTDGEACEDRGLEKGIFSGAHLHIPWTFGADRILPTP
ncbi:hypothetical protein BD769DRAFT_1422549 [Suillus cothurnatus]|nr:hypothetical protein BD769DRAFT_1422549 [Suillus cothurnatus]